ncbi:hypothetical protein NCLIV_057170 [Neospora caninum Liverpool]|uniref:Phytanoyl-CoA dioxygenase (PhyH) superfamily protein n=1 Tax=Neospora caninum (strain Liverpool) TaxID=572307 RepID=F0VNJ8_NEOCL|nr:hypothetical protein NCLIV_057170 [Neospora caninum Liverpool]CBZ55294.1 hypothetical protein NCLIV_057170 [Neospora caninum Liverpool]|eukprot:XP_003885322.1 hypothetical protein NCLIV_057170 [Neospora caninum Liverpool]
MTGAICLFSRRERIVTSSEARRIARLPSTFTPWNPSPSFASKPCFSSSRPSQISFRFSLPHGFVASSSAASLPVTALGLFLRVSPRVSSPRFSPSSTFSSRASLPAPASLPYFPALSTSACVLSEASFSSVFCARFSSSTSSPSGQAATAAAAGRAAAAAAKRREERRSRERWMKLQKGAKLGGGLAAALALSAGSIVWFLASVKRRHPPPPLDPQVSLPSPLTDKLCLSPVPLSSLLASVPSSVSSSSSSASACCGSCSVDASSSSSSLRTFPNVFPSARALDELCRKYPSFPASKAVILQAASHVVPVEYHLHLRDAFCRYLSLRLAEVCGQEKGNECSGKQCGLTVESVRETMRELWGVLGVEGSETTGDNAGNAFFSLINFDKEIETFLSRLSAASSPPSACCAASSPSFCGSSSCVAEFVESVREKISDVLVTNWQRQRYFDPLTFKRSALVRRISHEAAGRDVVRAVPEDDAPLSSSSSSSSSSSLSSEPVFLGTHEIQKAVENLKEFGVCIIRNGLTRQQLEVLQRTLHTDEAMAISSAMAMQEEDPNVWCTRPTTGRLHCLLRGTLLEAPLVDAQRVWMPLVFSYLPCEGRGAYTPEPDETLTKVWKTKGPRGEGRPAGDAGKLENSRGGDEIDDGEADPKKGLLAVSKLGKRVYVSDMQSVDADPLAITQPWHRDTSARGLTVLVPLCDITEANGPTELLPRSHTLCPSKPLGWRAQAGLWRAFLSSLFCESGGSWRPTLKAGDLLIYDSRVVHRGLGNNTWHSRPVLAFRYDYEDQPPPGEYAKRWKSQRTFLFGRAVERLLGLYNQL